MASENYHEPVNELSSQTRDMHRALQSLMEESEAIDWYNQRIEVCQDAQLRRILEHNRNEEMEHAAMVMEWLRRNNSEFAEKMKEYLYKEGEIAKEED